MPLVISSLFAIIFFLLLFFVFFDKQAVLENLKYKNFYLNYSLYLPLVFFVFSIIIFYILYLFKIIFRLKSVIFTTIIYLLIFGFFLFLGIDLLLFEPRYAEFLNLIILTFSYPLIISSIFTILLVIIFSLKSKKS